MMMYPKLPRLVALLLNVVLHVSAQGSALNLTVVAPSGTYTGLINGTVPNVRQFVGIRYAQPPIGNLRWMPPVKPDTNSSDLIPAVDIGLACPQYGSIVPNVFNQNLTQNQPPWGSQNSTPGTMVWSSGEDCLSLAVWTPISATNTSKLPVMIFIAGGGFVNSGTYSAAWYKPHHWVERTQAHVSVHINYRLNIMGYPGAQGLQNNNLGQEDQRLAVEWVRDNIEAFGGDPEHITLWGESAGAVATDYYNFAYPDDPIVTGFHMDSGSVLTVPSVNRKHDPIGSNFTFIASHFGCAELNASEQLVCMRSVPAYDIITFMGNYQDNSSTVAPDQTPIAFIPNIDDKLIFSNYTERYSQQAYSMLPAIYSSCANEFAALLTFALGIPNPPATLSRLSPDQQALVDNYTMSFFFCPAAESAEVRESQNQTTYRLWYGGNFTNVSPLPYLGPYHSADLAMYMGSYQDFNGQGPPLQYETSAAMQDFHLAFMRDPQNGPKSLGFAEAASGQMTLFGADGKAAQNVSLAQTEAACTGAGPYNAYP